jgi:acyl CoA:acetate/3-ketoacid CoA transferase alpha subunit
VSEKLDLSREHELKFNPQGTLAERIRTVGAEYRPSLLELV